MTIRPTVADLYSLNHVTEVARELIVSDEVPHIFTRKSRPQPAEFLITRSKNTSRHLTKLIQSPRQRARAKILGSRGRSLWPSFDWRPSRIWRSAPRGARPVWHYSESSR